MGFEAKSYPQITQTRLRSGELRRGRLHRFLSSRLKAEGSKGSADFAY